MSWNLMLRRHMECPTCLGQMHLSFATLMKLCRCTGQVSIMSLSASVSYTHLPDESHSDSYWPISQFLVMGNWKMLSQVEIIVIMTILDFRSPPEMYNIIKLFLIFSARD